MYICMRMYSRKELFGIAGTTTNETRIKTGPCIFKSFGVGFLMFSVVNSVHSKSRCQETLLQDTTSCLHSPQLDSEPRAERENAAAVAKLHSSKNR